MPAGGIVRLRSRADGFAFEAYQVRQTDARRGGLVMLPAIWGVTPHLQALADSFADDGYDVVVPSLTDRTDPGFPALDLDEAARPRRIAAAEAVEVATAMGDVQAAIDALAPPVFAVGFCFGGTMAWLAAARCRGLTAVSAFYGGAIAANLDQAPQVPVILHFGKTDALIPPADVERVREAYPELPVFLYEAGHAFMAPSDFHADSADLARLRTLQHFHRSGGKAEMGS